MSNVARRVALSAADASTNIHVRRMGKRKGEGYCGTAGSFDLLTREAADSELLAKVETHWTVCPHCKWLAVRAFKMAVGAREAQVAL